jgi:heparinase II/III-like protein
MTGELASEKRDTALTPGRKKVPTPQAALERLGLAADRRVADFSAQEMQAFRLLIGWEPGGPVVEYPTGPEQEARQQRERWKAERAGRGKEQPCLLLREGNIEIFRANVERDPDTARWHERFMGLADQVAQLPLSLFDQIIPAQGPWNVAGSFCPHCVGEKSDYTIHHPFWRWSPLAPEQIQCPHCGIIYPHSDYPEEGRLELPRLGLTYAFYLSPLELESPDWREGRHASSFGGAPTHVSLSGEVRRCALSWALGQVEPLGVAYALSGDEKYARAAATILQRMAEVYARYPVYSYRQEYSDAEQAYAVDQVDALPTPFKRAAFHYTYSGRWGDLEQLHGKQATTAAISAYPNGEWGTSRLGREKASNGQLFLSLFKGYDLIKKTLAPDLRTRIEADFLLELYLDTKGLSRRCDNKAGPGAAARVAVAVFYDDREEREAGLEQFRQVVEGQFYADGSWKETPIYGAKSLFEGMAEIPELLRGSVDVYADPLYGSAFEAYARATTPLGTQPAMGDSPADYCLQTYLGDLARIRLGVEMPPRPDRLEGLDLLQPERVSSSTGYVAGLECVALDESEERHSSDGAVGFAPVGHAHRRAGRPSAVSMFTEQRPNGEAAQRPGLNQFFPGRGLACLGWGDGGRAVQLYVNGDDGRRGHRHADPLNITLFAAGRELLPDLGYIADHPANGWVRCTAAHNTVVVDGGSVQASGRGTLRGWEVHEDWRFCDLSVPVTLPGNDQDLPLFRRAIVLLRLPGDGLLLVDLFDVEGGQTRDYLVRVNDPERRFQVPGMEFSPRSEALFQEMATPPRDFHTAGSREAPFVATWGDSFRVTAHVLVPCDEVIRFQSPAWRNAQEVFEDPERSWDTMCLRQSGERSRFAVVYEVAPWGRGQSKGVGQPWREGPLMDVELAALQPDLAVRLQTSTGIWEVSIGESRCKVRRG